MPRKRRSDNEIRVTLLILCKPAQSLGVLAYAVNSNYVTVRKHMKFLIENEFIEKKVGDTKMVYATTDKGKEVVDKYLQFLGLMSPEKRLDLLSKAKAMKVLYS